MTDWSAKLDEMLNLEDGWNSYKAPAPSPIAVQNARVFLAELEKQNFLSPRRVMPSAVGGVGVTLGEVRHVYVEFYNQGQICALFADDDTETCHTKVINGMMGHDQVMINGFVTLIEEAKKYLRV